MDDVPDSLIISASKRLFGSDRRSFMAEVPLEIWPGSPRIAERRLGWVRQAVPKGLHVSVGTQTVPRRQPGPAMNSLPPTVDLPTDLRTDRRYSPRWIFLMSGKFVDLGRPASAAWDDPVHPRQAAGNRQKCCLPHDSRSGGWICPVSTEQGV